MKLFKWALAVFTLAVTFVACQKELGNDPNAVSEGTLKSDATGDCLPSSVNGVYKKDSTLTSYEYIDVNVNITAVGTFSVVTDTVNGFTFRGKGTFGILGNNLVRLYGTGKPLAAGISTFTVKYGTSTCSIDVNVLGPNTGSAIYTLGGAGGTCTGFLLGAGTYTAGTILVAANSATTNVNVTQAGSYTATTDTVNGIWFNTANVFTTVGGQSITLAGHGTPTSNGSFNYTLNNGSTSCTFTITVGSGGPAAVYTLGGNGGNCTNTVLTGNYQQGQALSGATAKVDVTVATAGSYTLTTAAVNGVTFSASGTFTATGPQTVTLTGNGTPTLAGTNTYTISGASTTCSFPVTFTAPAPPASYSLDCSATGTPAGTYTTGTALSPTTNTVTLQVNVTTVGAYTLSTNTVNGMTFSKTGVFTTTGTQTVVLAGSGTPVAAGTNTFTTTGATNSCTFDVTAVAGTSPTDKTWEYTVSGIKYSGNCDDADNSTSGEVDIAGTSPQDFSISFSNSAGAITTGAYSGTATSGKTMFFAGNGGTFAGGSVLGTVIPFTNLNATITTYDEVNHVIQGTFSGTVLNATTFTTVTLTGGKFKAYLP